MKRDLLCLMQLNSRMWGVCVMSKCSGRVLVFVKIVVPSMVGRYRDVPRPRKLTLTIGADRKRRTTPVNVV